MYLQKVTLYQNAFYLKSNGINFTTVDVLQYIGYVYERPHKYKGHVWKISAAFATWVVNGTPTMKK